MAQIRQCCSLKLGKENNFFQKLYKEFLSFFSILLSIDRIFRNKVLMWLFPVCALWRSLVKNRKSYVLFFFLFRLWTALTLFFFFRLLSHRCACPQCSQMRERKWLWLLANWVWFFVSSLFIRPSCFFPRALKARSSYCFLFCQRGDTWRQLNLFILRRREAFRVGSLWSSVEAVAADSTVDALMQKYCICTKTLKSIKKNS